MPCVRCVRSVLQRACCMQAAACRLQHAWKWSFVLNIRPGPHASYLFRDLYNVFEPTPTGPFEVRVTRLIYLTYMEKMNNFYFDKSMKQNVSLWLHSDHFLPVL